MRVILEVVEGTQAGKRFEFDRHDTFMVGRSDKAHFCIPNDLYFSRFHFMVEANPPECFLRDLGSTNGTHVNGEPVVQARLNDGDLIRAGRTYFRVRVLAAEPGPTAPEPPELQPVAPVPDGEAPEAAGDIWTDTQLRARAAPTDRPAQLHCAVCGKLATDTVLGDMTDTRLVTYVCRDCRDHGRDERHPIPNFELLQQLGSGALGPVYKARRQSTGVVVALKTFPPHLAADGRATRLFLREMQLSAQLDHPNIVRLVEMGDAGGDLWIAAEYVDGIDAAKLARQLGGTVPLRDAIDILCQTLDALEYAHNRNLVHRDVKPSNILVTGSPGAYTARLADFGLMKNMDEAGMTGITREGEVRGTVPYMPPEQVLDCRFVKPAGDIYQAGASLYWLLTGRFVYDFEARDRRGEVRDPFLVILEDPIVPIRQVDPSIPQAIAEAIETALQREPQDRFETPAEMAAALRAAVS